MSRLVKILFLLLVGLLFTSCNAKEIPISNDENQSKYLEKQEKNYDNRIYLNVNSTDNFTNLLNAFMKESKNNLTKDELEIILSKYNYNKQKSKDNLFVFLQDNYNNPNFKCNSNENDCLSFNKYLKLLLKEKGELDNKQKSTIDYYVKTIADNKVTFEYFVYFVGVILITIGLCIFVVSLILGVWQKNKINTYDDELKEYKADFEKMKNNLNTEFKYIRDNLDKKKEKLEKLYVKGEDLINNLSNIKEERKDEMKILKASILNSLKNLADEDTSSTDEDTSFLENDLNNINNSEDPF